MKDYDACAGSILFRRDGQSSSDKRVAGPFWDLDTDLGSGRYRQVYLATLDSKTDWARYAANLKTFVTTRSLWFSDRYAAG